MVLVEADVGNADNQRCNCNECYHFSIFSLIYIRLAERGNHDAKRLFLSLMRQTIEKDGVRMKVSDASRLLPAQRPLRYGGPPA